MFVGNLVSFFHSLNQLGYSQTLESYAHLPTGVDDCSAEHSMPDWQTVKRNCGQGKETGIHSCLCHCVYNRFAVCL